MQLHPLLRQYLEGRLLDNYGHSLDRLTSLFPHGQARFQPLSATNLSSYLEEGEIVEELESLVTLATLYSSQLFQVSPDDIIVTDSCCMTNAVTRPVRVDLKLADFHETTIYIKEFDPMRVFGLELYSSALLEADFYLFAVNDEHIVEMALEGKHEYDLSDDKLHIIKQTDNYKRGIIMNDLLWEFFGFNDLRRPDNYIVTDLGDVKLIDFDNYSYNIPDCSQVQEYHQETMELLCINLEEYESIYGQEKAYLQKNVQRNSQKLNKLLSIYDSLNDGKYLAHQLRWRFDNLLRRTSNE